MSSLTPPLPPPAQFLGLPQALMLSADTELITPQGSPAPCVTPTQHLSEGNSLLWYLPFQPENKFLKDTDPLTPPSSPRLSTVSGTQ